MFNILEIVEAENKNRDSLIVKLAIKLVDKFIIKAKHAFPMIFFGSYDCYSHERDLLINVGIKTIKRVLTHHNLIRH